MRKYLPLLSAAALSVAGLCIPTIAADNPSGTPGNPADMPTGSSGSSSNGGALAPSPGAADVTTAFPSGQPVADADATAIRTLLGKVTDSAVSPNAMSDLKDQLCQRDSDRISKQDVKSDDIAAVANQIRQDWRDKYRDDFRVKDESVVYNDSFRIIQGDVSDQARMAGERFTPSSDNNGKSNLNGSTPPSGNSSIANPPTNANVPTTPGTGMDNRNGAISSVRSSPPAAGTQPSSLSAQQATVVIPASHGLPTVALPLRNEGTISKQWKIALPANCDAQQFHDNLLKQLTAFRDDKANWPAEENDAYRMATHRVAAAFANTGSGANGSEAVPSGSTDRPYGSSGSGSSTGTPPSNTPGQ